MNPSDYRMYYFALGGGALLWLGTAHVSGRSEAWDSPLYWSVAYPLCLLLAGVLFGLATAGHARRADPNVGAPRRR